MVAEEEIPLVLVRHSLDTSLFKVLSIRQIKTPAYQNCLRIALLLACSPTFNVALDNIRARNGILTQNVLLSHSGKRISLDWNRYFEVQNDIQHKVRNVSLDLKNILTDTNLDNSWVDLLKPVIYFDFIFVEPQVKTIMSSPDSITRLTRRLHKYDEQKELHIIVDKKMPLTELLKEIRQTFKIKELLDSLPSHANTKISLEAIMWGSRVWRAVNYSLDVLPDYVNVSKQFAEIYDSELDRLDLRRHFNAFKKATNEIAPIYFP